MSTVLGRSLALAFGGLVAGLGLVLALFGGDLRERWAPAGDAAAPRSLAAPPAAAPEGGSVAARPETPVPGAASPLAPAPSVAGPGREAGKAAEADPTAPSFDVVRVEPNGESVVAGRAQPDATVEMLVDGKPVAQARTDRDGQFAIVPPPLPPGSSEIVLRATGADGREVRSKQSVAVALPASREGKPLGKPLVALTAPDSPTSVLSQPDPAPKAGPGAKATPLRIVSVDAQENGRLFVSSEAPPGAAVRLYLNDTLIAPAQAGADGKVTFTIGKGVRPGAYRVRVDQVDSETGKVRIRAEVPFTVPEPAVRVAARATPDAPRSDAAPNSGPVRMEAAKPDPTKPDPTKPDPTKAETAKPEPTRPERGRPEQAKPESGAPVAALEAGRPDRPAAARPGTPAAQPEAAQRPSPNPARPAAVPPRREAGAEPGAAPPAGSRADPGSAPPARTADTPPAPGSVFVPEISTARIERGNSLWQISKRTYGRGNRYTVIYDANQDQIRDPDLIYPGQIFVLPEDKDGSGQGGRKRG